MLAGSLSQVQYILHRVAYAPYLRIALTPIVP